MAKTRVCKYCKERVSEFVIVNMSSFCSYDHAAKYAIEKSNANKAKKAKKAHSEKKKAFKLTDIKLRRKAAVTACHAYIRARDKDKPCICCGKPLGDTFHAGHFLNSNMNPLVRFDEDNIHGQRVDCNYFHGGDSGDYEKNLRERIGDEKVDLVLSKKAKSIKRNAQDYLEIERYYKDKIKLL